MNAVLVLIPLSLSFALLASMGTAAQEQMSSSYTFQGPYAFPGVTLIRADRSPVNVSSSTGLPIVEVSSLEAFNDTQIGMRCVYSTAGGGCGQWLNETTGAWYYDGQNGLLYVTWWNGKPATTITVVWSSSPVTSTLSRSTSSASTGPLPSHRGPTTSYALLGTLAVLVLAGFPVYRASMRRWRGRTGRKSR